jgi:hypothetical protein
MMRLSAAGIAALSLIHAQRFVADRFDGSWWILDEAKWDLIHRLSIEEHRIVLAVIDAQNVRRAEERAA